MRKPGEPWKILSVLDSADVSIAQDELKGGCNGFVLKTLDSVQALRGLPLHTFSIRNEAGDVAALALADLIEKQPIDPARLDICFGASDEVLSLRGFKGPFYHIAHDELSAIMTEAKALKSTSLSVSLIARPHMFETLARFRALRSLWQKELPLVALNLHAEVQEPTGETNEQYMLRCVSSAMGAGLGGADSITIAPHTSGGEFERRMVRNIQNILLRESHLADVHDAAAGSHYVEQLTQELLENATCA
jgi:hypothetical protein